MEAQTLTVSGGGKQKSFSFEFHHSTRRWSVPADGLITPDQKV
jgi:hypothetical protein